MVSSLDLLSANIMVTAYSIRWTLVADSEAKPKQLLNKVVEKSGGKKGKKKHPKTLVTSKLNI